MLVNCESEKPEVKPKPEEQQVKKAPSKLESELLKMLRKEGFNRDLIFEETKDIDLQAKLALVNRLAKEHSIKRMNMLKARVRMGTIDHQQKSEQYKKEKQEHLKTIDSILREKAKEEGLLKE